MLTIFKNLTKWKQKQKTKNMNFCVQYIGQCKITVRASTTTPPLTQEIRFVPTWYFFKTDIDILCVVINRIIWSIKKRRCIKLCRHKIIGYCIQSKSLLLGGIKLPMRAVRSGALLCTQEHKEHHIWWSLVAPGRIGVPGEIFFKVIKYIGQIIKEKN